MYEYKGQCLPMGDFDAGTLDGEPVTFQTTVHGPVVGYATVDGEKVAISSKRSSYGKDSLDLLYNRRLSNGQVHSAKSFMKAASLTPQTFNSFYIDDKNIAMYTAGLLPIRNKKVDPGLPTLGTGKYEWTGFLDKKDHPQGIDPEDGTITNWNQTTAKGFAAADNEFGHNGSVGRIDLLEQEPRPARVQEGQVEPAGGDLGDERRGDPGRARDRHRAAAEAAAQGHHGPDAAGAADARPDDRLEAARRQPPRPRPRRLHRRPRRRGHGRLLEQRSPTRSWRRSSAISWTS